jgi:hypothetical protein
MYSFIRTITSHMHNHIVLFVSISFLNPALKLLNVCPPPSNTIASLMHIGADPVGVRGSGPPQKFGCGGPLWLGPHEKFSEIILTVIIGHGKLLASYVSSAITEQEYHNKLITYVMFQVSINLRNTNCSLLSYVVRGVSVRRYLLLL